MSVRVIVLGNESAGDDGAAIAAARRLPPEDGVEIVIAGRPGVGLLELLDPSVRTVLADVVQSGAGAGRIHEMRLEDVLERARAHEHVSSHGFGPAETLRLAQALGRPLPSGFFVGIEGASFEPGAAPTRDVAGAIEELVRVLRAAIDATRSAPAR